MNKTRRYWIAYLLLGVALLLSSGAAFQVLAQEDVWGPLVNISQSGSAMEPVLAIDAEGGFHVFWQDTTVGFMVSHGDGREWSVPELLQLPFTEPPFFFPGNEDFEAFYTPHILIDADNVVHGFWINGTGNLLSSRAPLALIADRASWTFPVVLAQSAVAMDVKLDGNGRFHLSYIRPQQSNQFPSGVYYRSSNNSGIDWTDGFRIYESQYLSVTPDMAQINLAESGEIILVAWDNRLLDSVFVARSADGGLSWGEPITIDSRKPEDDADTLGPTNINVAFVGDEAHLTWRAEHATAQCLQYHQWSRNSGEIWQPEPKMIPGGSLDCPLTGQFVRGQNDLFFLLTVYTSSAFLQLWDGDQWSKADLQEPLARFTNEITFRQVDFRCHQTAVSLENQLFVVGCGQGNDFDAWVMNRPLGEFTDWSTRFLPTPAWAAPKSIDSSPVQYLMPELVVAGDGRLHAFWSRGNNLSDQSQQIGNAIYYSRLNAGQWSPARPIITSPTGKTDQPSVVSDSSGSLFVVWSGGQAGQIYFSRARADRASSVSEWTIPLPLPSPREAGGWPDMAIDSEDTLYVAYAIPLNEGRGIYITQSSDGGDTWSSPIQVFDGVTANWQMVGQPHLALADDGSLHLAWIHATLPGGTGPLALVYARSGDGGQSWSDPVEMVQRPVWSEMVAVGDRSLHLAWLAIEDGHLVLSYQTSIDNGLAWSPAGTIFSPGVLGGPATLISGANGPHLLQLAQKSDDGQQLLQEWLWDGARWLLGENLPLELEVLEASGLTAVSAPDGRLGVLMANLFLNENTGQLQHDLHYTERLWEAPVSSPTPLPTLTPTPLPSPTNTPVPQPSPTPQLDFSASVELDEGFKIGPFSADDNIGNIVISLIPVILILAVFMFVGINIARSK